MSTTQPEPQTDRVLRWRLAGEEYELRPLELPIKLESECRRETGMDPYFLYNHDRDQFGRSVLAALCWLARRQAGVPAVQQVGRITTRLWDQVGALVTWEALGTLEWLDDGEEPADPEAPAGS